MGFRLIDRSAFIEHFKRRRLVCQTVFVLIRLFPLEPEIRRLLVNVLVHPKVA